MLVLFCPWVFLFDVVNGVVDWIVGYDGDSGMLFAFCLFDEDAIVILIL